ncbi:SigE family RNA polymerase sigma factor [Nocardioides sp. L-11A]|uniref:SigE family RNA polymerase sigma factor n=1 Tax=Nocardioides sp. L-11A TaxID=3043848 RepID=UPI00249C51C1|nr:SigE family RNA polymerase sigma factor [Nocardioides sp. L-11A]
MEFAEFVVTRRPALVRAVVLMGSPLADAEDIVQSALTTCYRHWTKVRRAGSPEAYVYRILVNTRASTWRRKWRGELPTDDLPDGITDPDLTTGIAVRQALAAMPAAQREVLVLRYYADLTEREIADVLRIAPGTVKSRAARGLAALATTLRSPDAHG